MYIARVITQTNHVYNSISKIFSSKAHFQKPFRRTRLRIMPRWPLVTESVSPPYTKYCRKINGLDLVLTGLKEFDAYWGYRCLFEIRATVKERYEFINYTSSIRGDANSLITLISYKKFSCAMSRLTKKESILFIYWIWKNKLKFIILNYQNFES